MTLFTVIQTVMNAKCQPNPYNVFATANPFHLLETEEDKIDPENYYFHMQDDGTTHKISSFTYCNFNTVRPTHPHLQFLNSLHPKEQGRHRWLFIGDINHGHFEEILTRLDDAHKRHVIFEKSCEVARRRHLEMLFSPETLANIDSDIW